jgi:UDP-N-acetylglucosamine 2-epimerase (non-hydrolysing)
MTILGTRPEIIRLSVIIPKLDKISEHLLVHTGQNYEESLNDVFFRELDIRKPDHSLGIKGATFGEQIGKIIAETETILASRRPDKLLILGDTNSGLSAIAAKRLGIPVYHMEAGNRCFDDRVPEEVNRRIIDHSSDILMPYTERSKENLVNEGIDRQRIFVTGNPICEVMEHFDEKISASDVLDRLRLNKGKYFLVTVHRSENVDVELRLNNILVVLDSLAKQFQMPVIVSLHPRTKSKMNSFHLSLSNSLVRQLTPLGFFDFIALEKNALCVLSDSGTVQEECCILKVPNITIRDVTERPETLECGSNIIGGNNPTDIMGLVAFVVSSACTWNPPLEYVERNVSDKILRILLSAVPPGVQRQSL